MGRGPSPSGSLKLPGQVVGLSGVVQVTVGDGACHARKSDGTWWVWGYGTSRLGDGDNSYNTPIVVLGFAGTSTVLSSLGTRDTADSWLFQNFSVPELLNDSLVSDTATPAGDGIPNLLKYALGLDPRLSGASALPTTRVDLAGAAAQSESASGNQVQLFSLPTVDLTSGKRYTAFTVNRNGGIRQDIDYIVEVSNDLQSWHSGDPFTITVLDTAETLEVYDATAIEDAPRRFMRLRIRRK